MEIMFVMTNYAKNYASTILLLHNSHNAPKVLHGLCFSFLLGIAVVPGEIVACVAGAWK